MTHQVPTGIPRDPASWLAEGPEHAPATLLGAILEQTRGTRQRPALVASLFGTTTGADPSRAFALAPARVWLAAAVALLALITAVVIVGMSRRDATVILPSRGPSTGPSAVPTGTPAPSGTPVPTLIPSEMPAVYEAVFPDELAITIPGGAAIDRGEGQAIITTDVIRVLIDRWPLGSSHAIPGVGGSIDGADLDAIALNVDALLAARPRLSEMRRGALNVNYARAVQWVLPSLEIHADEATPFQVVVVVSGKTVLSFVGFPVGSATPGPVLIQFGSMLASGDLLAPTEVIGLDNRIAFTISGSEHVALSTADVLTIQNEGISLFSRSLRIQRASVGATLVLGPISGAPLAIRLSGTTLDEYVASLRRSNPAMFGVPEPVSIGGVAGYRWRTLASDTILGRTYNDVVLVVEGGDVFGFVGDLQASSDIRFLP